MKTETIRIGQIDNRFLLEAADTNGFVAMFEFTVPVGAKVPLPATRFPHTPQHHEQLVRSVLRVTDHWSLVPRNPAQSLLLLYCCAIKPCACPGF